MPQQTYEKGSAEELAHLQRERDEADRRYNDALTRLDAAIQKGRDLPHPPPAYDEFQINTLNQRWELLSLKPEEGSGWLKRLRTHAWAMVAPLFERQQAFNSALVDHVNRNIAVHRATRQALESTLATIGEDERRLIEYQTLVILYLQQITPYVDTKDRHVAGLMHGLAAGLSSLTDELQKRWEWMLARDARMLAATRYEAQVSDLRTPLSVMQHAVQTLKRQVEQASESHATAQAKPEATTRQARADASAPSASSLDSYKYVAFEDQFRGSQHAIRERLMAYVPMFAGATDVLDVGCGRGEFLDLLREQGIKARGIDLNDEMAAVSRERNLDATVGDALAYLGSLPDASLGGLFAAQVVEHLEPDYLMRFLDAAYHKLRPGSKIVLETINPACWFAFFSSYIRDITHERPLHPDTLQYLLRASGFQRVTVRYSAPYPEESKLQQAPGRSDFENVFNENVTKLNSLLFTHLDYAAIGERM